MNYQVSQLLNGAAVVIGVARVWVGVHYPGDILAAAAIAGPATLEVKTGVLWLSRSAPA
jgi:membrane-associated phospholipid phosphatase